MRPRAAGELGELITLRIAAALEAAGIANVPLKGPLLARALHGDTAMRSSRDIDLLVARADLGASVEALAAARVARRPGRGGARAPRPPRRRTPVCRTSRSTGACTGTRARSPRAPWRERRRERTASGGCAPRTSSSRCVLYHARDGFAGLRHATDLAAWWDGDRDPVLARPLLGVTIAAHPSLERALTASAIVLDPLVGIPSGALVPAASRPPRGVRRAARLANPLMRGSAAQITAEVSLVDGLIAPPGRRRAYVRRRALASPQQLPPDPAGRPLALRRAEHVTRLLARSAVALVRRRPGPR